MDSRRSASSLDHDRRFAVSMNRKVDSFKIDQRIGHRCARFLIHAIQRRITAKAKRRDSDLSTVGASQLIADRVAALAKVRLKVDSLVLLQIHPVIRKQHDLRFVAAVLVNALQDLVQRLKCNRQAPGPAYVHQTVGALQKRKEVTRLRSAAKSFMEALHVRAPDRFRSEVDEELERQRFLVIQFIHI